MAKCFASKQVQMLNAFIVDAPCTLVQPLVGRSHLTDTIVEASPFQTHGHFFDLSHYIWEFDLFIEKTIDRIYTTTCSQPVSVSAKPRKRLQFPFISQMQIILRAYHLPAPLLVSQLAMQAVQVELKKLRHQLIESWDARYKKEPNVASSSPCHLPRSSKYIFLFVTLSPTCFIHVLYSALLVRAAAGKPAPMSFCVPRRALIVAHKKGWWTVIRRLLIHSKLAVGQASLDVFVSD